MFPPSSSPAAHIDLSALSGISGSISIACWIVVFSPQILENFRRSSADGLSITFIIIWLAGDVFNIAGAILQNVLPTMIILAVYYTLADLVLLAQCWYYRGFIFIDSKPATNSPRHGHHIGPEHDGDGERRPLLNGSHMPNGTIATSPTRRSNSRPSSPFTEMRRRLSLTDGNVDSVHLSPAVPLNDAPELAQITNGVPPKHSSALQTFLLNSFAILLVCAAGVLGWWISVESTRSKIPHHRHNDHDGPTVSDNLEFDVWGQVFGYLCAIFYLGSRVPQLLLNYRRKSTEGVSLLFFLFACIGNLTFDMSIFAYDPRLQCDEGAKHCRPGEAAGIYGRYLAINASWIAGSLGTLALDLAIFVQFFLYKEDDSGNSGNENRGSHNEIVSGHAD